MQRILACLAFATAALAQNVGYYSAHLTGDQENPPSGASGSGWGVVRFDSSTNVANIFLHHTTLTGPSVAAHLHIGAVGVNGGILIGLTQTTTGNWSGTGTLSAANASAFLAGGCYLNVHTGANPGGEIRGQVVTATSTRLTAVITGAQEVPPTGATGTGTATMFLHEPENRVAYVVESTGLVNVVAAHIHNAAVGVNGPIIVPLVGGNGSYCGVSEPLSASLVNALKTGGCYVNIHTAANPGGEIRGQVAADQGDHWFANADGVQETPPNPSGGFGNGSLIVGPTGAVTFTGAFAGLSAPVTASHIHVGAPGVAGGIEFALTITGGPTAGTLTGTLPSPTVTQLNNLRAGNWYLNIHSTAFPGGEIRGQLRPATLPSTFGAGCVSSTGQAPQAAATGFAALASTMSMDLRGGVPNSLAILVLGANRDTVLGLPAPLELTTVGFAAPTCFALIDPVGSIVAFCDPRGCTGLNLTLPLTLSLRGTSFNYQWIVFDTGIGANPANMVTSNGVSFRIH